MVNSCRFFNSESAKINFQRLFCLLFILCTSIIFPAALAQAQQLTPDTVESRRDTLAREWPIDSLDRRTPRGTVSGFISAVADQNYARAAFYLNLDTALVEQGDSVMYAKSLQQLMDKNGRLLPYAWMSDSYDGSLDDNLGPNLDRVGSISINNEEFDLIVEKLEAPDGGPLWLFSSQTIQRIPLPVAESTEEPLLDKVAPQALEENKWGGVPVAHWLGMVLLAVLSYLFAKGITSFILFIIPLLWAKARNEATAGIIRAFALPIRLYFSVWIFVVATRLAGISIIVRLRLSEVTVIVGLIALLLLLWRLLDYISRLVEKRLARHGNQAGVSAVLFLRRGAKVGLLVLGVILALDTFGFDVTTGIAALGIGGIALALGAQKTVENFVGSVTLIADQPVRVGDYCQVGDVVGTIEQIGMRSTRIRTANRTVVTIPNGEFSSLHIENYAPRDMFLFNPVLSLRYETTPDQIRFLLVELRSILYAHPKVDADPARVRFTELGKDALKLEVYAYILAKDFDEFLEIQEDIYLRTMDVVEASGSGFALPAQVMYVTRDKGMQEEKAREAEEQVNKWREAGEMQIPRFNSEYIRKLKNSIPYPPGGSDGQAKNK